MPRYILAELNTHRMLSKNSASSRAIPFKKMVESVLTNTYYPIAWMKDHKGMQGTEYFTNPKDIERLNQAQELAANEAIIRATALSEYGVTKQAANRYLEPFMWHTVLISGTEWDNFFDLRCPQYIIHTPDKELLFNSRKDLLSSLKNMPRLQEAVSNRTEVEWLKENKGAADIHIMALAEAIWDATNESTPRQLNEGGWHTPYEDKIDSLISANYLAKFEENSMIAKYINSVDIMDKVKVSTGMCARTSYTVVGEEKEINYEKLIGIHDKMISSKPLHASPMEHPSKTMTEDEFFRHEKAYIHYGALTPRLEREAKYGITMIDTLTNGAHIIVEYGWCRNYRGFIQYRAMID